MSDPLSSCAPTKATPTATSMRLYDYEDISEIAGPNDPVEASILRTLSAVDMERGGDGAKWAKAWRDRCSAYTNSLHSAPDWTKLASLEIAACHRERRGKRDTWVINVVDDAEAAFWTIYGRRKADQDGFEECEPITDCATRDHAQKIARILQERSGLSISTKLLIGNPATPLRESTMAAPSGPPGSRLLLVATKAPTANPTFALSDLEVAHKLARACGGEVIDTAVDRMADSDFLNQSSDEIQT